MSRKTKKLMWSVPLIAAVAVIGALALFLTLEPNGALAHEQMGHGAPGPVSGLTANVADDDPATGEVEGRTAIMLTWKMPAAGTGDPAETYRIDISTDTRVWRNLLGEDNADSAAALSDADADANCASGAAADRRCYPSTGLKPGVTYYYRVFAMNTYGISAVSVDKTYAFDTTEEVGDPSPVRVLTATDDQEEQINLDWQAPLDNGGADVLWYCIAVATRTSAFADPTATGEEGACREAVVATDTSSANADYTSAINTLKDADATNDATASTVIVVPATATEYEHTGLDDPPVITLRYRVYAVTGEDAEEVGDDDDRRITPAASNTGYRTDHRARRHVRRSVGKARGAQEPARRGVCSGLYRRSAPS